MVFGICFNGSLNISAMTAKSSWISVPGSTIVSGADGSVMPAARCSALIRSAPSVVLGLHSIRKSSSPLSTKSNESWPVYCMGSANFRTTSSVGWPSMPRNEMPVLCSHWCGARYVQWAVTAPSWSVL